MNLQPADKGPLTSWDRETLAAIQEGDLNHKRVETALLICKRFQDSTNGNKPTESEISDMLYDVAQLPDEKQAVCRQAILESKIISHHAYRAKMRDYAPKTQEKTRTPKPIRCARFDGLVDLVLDERRVRYLIAKPGGGLEVLDSFEKDGRKFAPPPVEQIPFFIADLPEVKTAWLTDEPCRLFADIILYLEKISLLPSENHLVLLAAWVFSTYRQEVLPYSGYLAFFNVAGRGKTRTGKALISAAFRGVHTITIREANLFRLSQDLQATIFFDVTDLSGKLARNDSEDVILSRFEKGARVFRTLFPDKGPFEDTVAFDIFGPSIIATNVALYRVLDTRCFPISMPHSAKHFPAPDPAEGLKLRERLLAWRAKQLFKPLADPGKIMAGRLGDIAMPLRSILQEVKPEAIPAFDELIEEMQQAGREDKSQSLAARIVQAVKILSIGNLGGEIPVSDIATKLNQGIGEESKAFVNPWKVGRLLKALGFKRGRSSKKRHIEVDKEDLESMCQEYGIEEPTETPLETSQTSQCHSSTDGPGDISGDITDSQMSLPDTDGEVTL